MASTAERVRIRYRRPPDREETFDQRVVARLPGCTVTLLEHARLKSTMRIGGAIALENGAPVVWFTFPDAWHDIGRFHTAGGAFTGLYANVLTPVEETPDGTWSTTDLFLDIWLGADGGIEILDRDELAAALAAGWLTPETAAAAEAEAGRIARRAAAGEWPPPVVREWTLERVRAAAAS